MLESLVEEFELMILIKSGKVHIISKRGKRIIEDHFKDIEQKLSVWFKKKTLLPGREGTNQKAVFDEYEACQT